MECCIGTIQGSSKNIALHVSPVTGTVLFVFLLPTLFSFILFSFFRVSGTVRLIRYLMFDRFKQCGFCQQALHVVLRTVWSVNKHFPWCGTVLSVNKHSPWCGNEIVVYKHCPWCGSEIVVNKHSPWCGSEIVVNKHSPWCGSENVVNKHSPWFCSEIVVNKHSPWCDKCIVPMGFLPWEIRVAFPGEYHRRQSRATQPRVRAGCFIISIIHRTLTWTTGCLTCAQMYISASAHGGFRTP